MSKWFNSLKPEQQKAYCRKLKGTRKSKHCPIVEETRDMSINKEDNQIKERINEVFSSKNESVLAETIAKLNLSQISKNLSPDLKEFNELNNEQSNYTTKQTLLRNEDNPLDYAAYEAYKELSEKTNHKFATYKIIKQILSDMVLRKKEYNNKSFEERVMFIHDKMLDVINTVRNHHTVPDVDSKTRADIDNWWATMMVEFANFVSFKEINAFTKVNNKGKKELFKHFHTFKNGTEELDWPTGDFSFIELFYKLSDVVRHQHDFFYKLSIMHNNIDFKLRKKEKIDYEKELKQLINSGNTSFDVFYKIGDYQRENFPTYKKFRKKFFALVDDHNFTCNIIIEWAEKLIKKECSVVISSHIDDYRKKIV